MRKILLAGLVCLAASSALTAAPTTTTKRDKSSRPVRIVVLGSSTSAGAGAVPREKSWVNLYREHVLAERPGSEVINLSVGGFRSFNILPDNIFPTKGQPAPSVENNITKALSHRPDAVILNLPSNDVGSGAPMAHIQRNYDIIAREAAIARVPLWVTTTQPRNFPEAKRQNQVILRDYLKFRFGKRCLDFWTGLAGPDNGLLKDMDYGDGVHINNSGHALVLERVIQADIPAAVAP